jgi:hypothetical protein
MKLLGASLMEWQMTPMFLLRLKALKQFNGLLKWFESGAIKTLRSFVVPQNAAPL